MRIAKSCNVINKPHAFDGLIVILQFLGEELIIAVDILVCVHVFWNILRLKSRLGTHSSLNSASR